MDHVSFLAPVWCTAITEMVHADYRNGASHLPNKWCTHLTEKWCIVDYRLHVSTFKRKFFKIYGTSPQKWLTQQKMRIAANLLKHPHERPGSVYEKVGYENQSSFILAFKKQYGMTPREYQQTNLS
jgi:AraC-like DNA-binding protein